MPLFLFLWQRTIQRVGTETINAQDSERKGSLVLKNILNEHVDKLEFYFHLFILLSNMRKVNDASAGVKWGTFTEVNGEMSIYTR